VMLLHDRLVSRPTLAAPAEPTRIVVEDTVRTSLGEPALAVEGG